MIPGKHQKRLQRSGRIRDILEDTGILLLFISGLLIIGPVIHETGHITALELLGCPYDASFGISFTGLYGSIQPMCSIKSAGSAFFYLSGYLGTVVAGSLAGVIAMELSDTRQERGARLAASIASGLLMSVALTVLVKGDFARLARSIGVRPVYATMTGLLLILMVSAVTLRIFEVVADTSEGQD